MLSKPAHSVFISRDTTNPMINHVTSEWSRSGYTKSKVGLQFARWKNAQSKTGRTGCTGEDHAVPTL